MGKRKREAGEGLSKRGWFIFISIASFILFVFIHDLVCLALMDDMGDYKVKDTPKRQAKEKALEEKTIAAAAEWVELRREFYEINIGYPDFYDIPFAKEKFLSETGDSAATAKTMRADVKRLRKAEKKVYKAMYKEYKYKKMMNWEFLGNHPTIKLIKYNAAGNSEYRPLKMNLDLYDECKKNGTLKYYADGAIFEYDSLNPSFMAWLFDKIFKGAFGLIILIYFGGTVLCELFGGIFGIFGKMPD